MVQVPLILRQFGKERLIDGLYHILTEQVVLEVAPFRFVVPISHDEQDAGTAQFVPYGVILALRAVILTCLLGNARQLGIIVNQKLGIVHVLLAALYVTTRRLCRNVVAHQAKDDVAIRFVQRGGRCAAQ